ncbi:hypothetical protein G6F46_010868 [Rhizopus delemar]|uniref:Late endosomal/lysosomal adaptor and MAPK and MTOR activator 5 n=2 Tax=Rhizopus TaxID=4842 RepID=A0A9P7CKE3_9FUNG|nr:hypothetical protein G6F55_010511 [Rhizopus delemar]KAG1536542.1 hypothetical protein G6F51_010911 [Rhizopus arrhizus]KAG1490810.1 hypothetical protein G6F54_010456 [Rhizopus delemar]KAG1503240.1 hypothetical protein G6F53_010672 [Rhizopus delemar]KAG1518309.1 hypothetical protein G6F52_009051 [Rhizopus delemar]
MDSELISTLDALYNKEGVKGVLVADEKGFCLGVRGIASPESSAFITAVANAANNLGESSEDKAECPTVNIEFENSQVVIRNEGAFTLAIFM